MYNVPRVIIGECLNSFLLLSQSYHLKLEMNVMVLKMKELIVGYLMQRVALLMSQMFPEDHSFVQTLEGANNLNVYFDQIYNWYTDY